MQVHLRDNLKKRRSIGSGYVVGVDGRSCIKILEFPDDFIAIQLVVVCS